jgi:release factor glutamine methyltransferase
VDVALTRIAPNESIRILDIGTGTGCIAITLALERPHGAVTAIDVSPDALALARENAQRLGAPNVNFIESNWFAALADDAQFDLIVSNPPYIVPGDVHLTQGDLRFEPAIALADAVDGLESYRQLLRGTVKHLRSGGWLVVEHGYDQGDSVPALFRAAGFTQVDMLRDLADMPRVTIGKWR